MLTLARLGVFSGLGGYCAFAVGAGISDPGWFPAVAYGTATLADGIDGVLARRYGLVSDFGALFDRETDAMGHATACAAAVLVLGSLPIWFFPAGFARYFFALGLRIEAVAGRARKELDPSRFRRRLAGFQMGLLAVCLIPGLTTRWSTPAAIVLGVPFLAGFVRDYLVASGRLDPAGARWTDLANRLAATRKPAALTSAALALVLLAAALGAGLPTGPLALGAFLLAWLLTPARTPK